MRVKEGEGGGGGGGKRGRALHTRTTDSKKQEGRKWGPHLGLQSYSFIYTLIFMCLLLLYVYLHMALFTPTRPNVIHSYIHIHSIPKYTCNTHLARCALISVYIYVYTMIHVYMHLSLHTHDLTLKEHRHTPTTLHHPATCC